MDDPQIVPKVTDRVVAQRNVPGVLEAVKRFCGFIESPIRREVGAFVRNESRAFSNEREGIIMTESIPSPAAALLRMTQVKARTGLSRRRSTCGSRRASFQPIWLRNRRRRLVEAQEDRALDRGPASRHDQPQRSR